LQRLPEKVGVAMQLLVIWPELVQRVITQHYVDILAQMHPCSQNGLRDIVLVGVPSSLDSVEQAIELVLVEAPIAISIQEIKNL
jgi:hypothetical protein